MKHTFIPNIRTVGKMPKSVYETDEIKYEPMIYSGDWKFTRQNGGPVTQSVLDQLESINPLISTTIPDHHIVIDIRVTMTMEGAYPSIPGWHCDDVPRGKKYAQPDVNLISPEVVHYMVLLADVETQSCTEFVDKPFTADIDAENVWSSLHKEVKDINPSTRFVRQGDIIRFDQNAIHRASPAKTPGWRYFFRLSHTHRAPANEIRKQVQVYLPSDDGGW